MPRTENPDRLIAALARAQHGVVSRAQLLAAGLTGRMVDHRMAGVGWSGCAYAHAGHAHSAAASRFMSGGDDTPVRLPTGDHQ